MLFIAVSCAEELHGAPNVLSSNLMSSFHLVSQKTNKNEGLFIACCVYSLLSRWIRSTELASSFLYSKRRERKYSALHNYVAYLPRPKKCCHRLKNHTNSLYECFHLQAGWKQSHSNLTLPVKSKGKGVIRCAVFRPIRVVALKFLSP